MNTDRFLLRVVLALSFAAFLPLQAKLPWVKKAQALGFTEITSCASCHSSDKPKKGDPLGNVESGCNAKRPGEMHRK